MLSHNRRQQRMMLECNQHECRAASLPEHAECLPESPRRIVDAVDSHRVSREIAVQKTHAGAVTECGQDTFGLLCGGMRRIEIPERKLSFGQIEQCNAQAFAARLFQPRDLSK